jgi:DNA-binding PadR family transcriptional regulator
MTARTVARHPLSPAIFAILLALGESEKHGYQIMKDARTLQGGSIRLGPGTLYGSIARLLRTRLVEESGISEDQRRRFYRLTAHGRAVLIAELERLDAALASAREQNLIPSASQS